ncbi:MAG: hypothetical protein LBF80_00080 [Spirochaetaceae bacterium]|jgi:hypothetical protein|nr:hypothetical protein [Spirochaetaceae bacterium]
MGLTMQEKKSVTKQVRSHYLKAGRKEKSAILDEFIRINGYKNRKYALRILNKPEPAETVLVVKGKAVKVKPLKKDPPTVRAKKSTPMKSSLPHFGHSGVLPVFSLSLSCLISLSLSIAALSLFSGKDFGKSRRVLSLFSIIYRLSACIIPHCSLLVKSISNYHQKIVKGVF